jgi:hypothetical protein
MQTRPFAELRTRNDSHVVVFPHPEDPGVLQLPLSDFLIEVVNGRLFCTITREDFSNISQNQNIVITPVPPVPPLDRLILFSQEDLHIRMKAHKSIPINSTEKAQLPIDVGITLTQYLNCYQFQSGRNKKYRRA